MFCLPDTLLGGCQREALREVLTAPEQPPPPPLTTDEAMNQAFGTLSEEEEDSEEEADRGQHHNYRFLFLVNFYSQLD
jgi:hypothetical protein